jgi:hypothetical protein
MAGPSGIERRPPGRSVPPGFAEKAKARLAEIAGGAEPSPRPLPSASSPSLPQSIRSWTRVQCFACRRIVVRPHDHPAEEGYKFCERKACQRAAFAFERHVQARCQDIAEGGLAALTRPPRTPVPPEWQEAYPID